MIKPVRWTTHHNLIPTGSIRAIHEASLRILERTGLVVPPIHFAMLPDGLAQGMGVDEGGHERSTQNRINKQAVQCTACFGGGEDMRIGYGSSTASITWMTPL